MFGFKKITLLVIPFSFVLGIYWGTILIQKKQDLIKNQLRVLSYKGHLPSRMLTQLKQEFQIDLNVVSAKDWNHWNDLIKTQRFDLLFAYHFQLEQLVSERKLSQVQNLNNFRGVSPDFFFSSKSKNYFIPFSWGFLGFAYQKDKFPGQVVDSWKALSSSKIDQKVSLRTSIYQSVLNTWPTRSKKKYFAYPSTQATADLLSNNSWATFTSTEEWLRELKAKQSLSFSLPKESIPFWVLSIAVSSTSRNKASAQKALRRLLSQKVQKKLSQEFSISSPLRIANQWRNIDPLQKPSYIRKISLNKLLPAPAQWFSEIAAQEN